MIDFLIKSTISLTVFIGFYHFVLERERIHGFNRFYLLATIVISFLIPFITFEFIKIVPTVKNLSLDPTPVIINNDQIKEHAIPMQESINYTPYIIWGIYGIVVFVLIMRFMINSFELISKSRTNPLLKYKNANLVLVHEKISPHTFLNFIYINIDEYNKNAIEEELFTHELVHVTEKHTLDILFVELLKCIFWFNPILYFYKKAIQLNHEFLADEKVVKVYSNIPYYQNLLLQKSSNVATVYLTTNLNYLITKKRLLMMTKSTTRKIALLKKIAIVPVFLGLVYFFCVKIIAQEKELTSNDIIKNDKITDKDKIRDRYYSGVYVKIIDEKNNRKEVTLYEKLTLEDRRKYLDLVPEIIIEKEIPVPLFENMKTKNMAVWINGKVVTKEEIKKFERTDFSYYTYSFVHKNARSKRFPQEYQYALYTKEYFDENLKNSHLHFGGDTIKIIYASYKTIKNDIFMKKYPVDTLVWYKEKKDGYNIYVNDGNDKFVEDEDLKKKRDYAYSGATITIIDKDRNVNVVKKYEDLDLKLKQRYLQTHMFYLAEKRIPSKDIFEEFKNEKEYLIFINDKRIDNSNLNKMKNSDIYYYAKMTNPPTSTRKYLYFLYTKNFFEKVLHVKYKKYVRIS